MSSQRIIFFSDTHLSPAQPDKTGFLIDFLNTHSKNTSFYILGDLFDIWIGPGHVKLLDYADILNTFKKLTDSDVEINFIPGNRDYMVGQELADATGVKVLPEIFLLTLPNKKVMLTHGDLLCTQDIAYQNYRRLMQSELVKSAARALPASVGTKLGKGLKTFSAGSDTARILPVKNIVPATIKRFFKQSFDAIVCGHIHKPSQTELNVANKVKYLFVVGSLNKDTRGNFQFSYAECLDGEIKIKSL